MIYVLLFFPVSPCHWREHTEVGLAAVWFRFFCAVVLVGHFVLSIESLPSANDDKEAGGGETLSKLFSVCT